MENKTNKKVDYSKLVKSFTINLKKLTSDEIDAAQKGSSKKVLYLIISYIII